MSEPALEWLELECKCGSLFVAVVYDDCSTPTEVWCGKCWAHWQLTKKTKEEQNGDSDD